MGVNMRWVGSRARMWRSVIKEFDIAEQMTVNDVITVNYCVNYGGRAEIAEAAQNKSPGRPQPGRSTRNGLGAHHHQAPAPSRHPRCRPVYQDVGGTAVEQRFMIWQAAYAEFIFQDKLWPDYDRRDCGPPARSTCTATADSVGPDVAL